MSDAEVNQYLATLKKQHSDCLNSDDSLNFSLLQIKLLSKIYDLEVQNNQIINLIYNEELTMIYYLDYLSAFQMSNMETILTDINNNVSRIP